MNLLNTHVTRSGTAQARQRHQNAHTGSAPCGQGRAHLGKATLRTLCTFILSFALVCALGMAGFAAEAQTVRYENQNNSNYNNDYNNNYSSQGGSYSSSDVLVERIGMGVLTGAVVAGVFCFICVRQLKTAVRQHSASDYVTGNGLHLTDRRDLYLFSNTVRRRRENNQGGRGGPGGGRGGPGGGPRGGGGRR